MWQNAKLTEYIVPLILITVSFEKKNAKVNCSLCSIIYDYFVYKDKWLFDIVWTWKWFILIEDINIYSEVSYVSLS